MVLLKMLLILLLEKTLIIKWQKSFQRLQAWVLQLFYLKRLLRELAWIECLTQCKITRRFRNISNAKVLKPS
ncbi:hypothetical protein ALP29_200661 [Pseudomonas syringae pv. avii]|uniref:Uncharacterized protein n=1 Tax=Pseudomonas syringae pv. avii TaxID=663959 RepID=A0A3M5VPJ4_PSESX|nr:hypothetical protein AL046_18460 [Pseudomonas syringae pv. avii]RMU59493.1 hypothetical protein ALP29_200661 [Pseudomonas syringae pv. avii]